ncbi:MAG: hypothetical protein M2R45_05190 [Verrucomicrobia subdivision 3 bacterium]|nr:hypothetical protein [Limisphaerales bacterium]MCS1417585.1 hypothetical protein [Limisphaerales bacterium]
MWQWEYITQTQMVVLQGLAYVNIHTAINPHSEIRGQTVKP